MKQYIGKNRRMEQKNETVEWNRMMKQYIGKNRRMKQ